MTRRSGNRDAVTSEDDIVRSTLDDHTVAVLQEAAAVRGLSIDQLIAALLRAATAHLDELLDYAPGVVVSGDQHPPSPKRDVARRRGVVIGDGTSSSPPQP